MIRIDVADAVTIHSTDGVLVIRAPFDDPLLPRLTSVFDTPGSAFRKLAQAIVENDFDVPSLACVSHERVFLFGDVTARVDGLAGESLSGSGRSTWVEQDLPPGASLLIEVSSDAEGRHAGPDSGTVLPPLSPDPGTHSESAVQEVTESSPAASPTHRIEPPLPTTPPEPQVFGTGSASVDIREALRHGSLDPPTYHSSSKPANPAVLPLATATESEGAIDCEATLDVDSVQVQLAGESRPAATIGGPPVAAKVCPCGAANPLTNSECRACRLNLRRDGVTIGQATRPSLGFLIFDDGFRHELTGPVVIGRFAPVDYLVGDQLAEAITVTSPQKHVSKGHVEVRLIGWTVNVIDLDSANGTYVEGIDGRAPRRLRPNIVEQIVSGDIVQFGDRSFTFEAAPGL